MVGPLVGFSHHGKGELDGRYQGGEMVRCWPYSGTTHPPMEWAETKGYAAISHAGKGLG